MRIGLDARSIGIKVCGVSRVTLRLIKALAALDKVNQYFVLTDVALIPELGGGNFKIIPTGCSRMNPFADRKFSGIVSELNLDVFHSIHSWLPFTMGASRAKKIVMIHDIFALTDPGFFAKYSLLKGLARWYFKALITRSAKNADIILTISEYSAKRILETFPFAAGKVQVVYLAAGLEQGNMDHATNKVSYGPYILYVGNCRSYKNVPTLIKGFALYLRADPSSNLSLVIAGNDHCVGVRELAEEYGVSDRIKFMFNPDDVHLKGLYSGALAFVMPSKEEGFGMPVLEAMGMGVPTIISDAEALLEVAGGAALVFPKNDPERLAILLQQVIKDEKIRVELRSQGLSRSAVFSWERSASKLKSCYEKCCTEVL